MACETFTNYKTKLDNALNGTPFSGTAPTQLLYAAGLVPGKSLANCILVDGIGGLYIGISPDDINPGAFGSEAESFIFILFCNCYSACIKIGASDDYGATVLDDIWPITSTSKYKECGASGIRTGRPNTLRDDYYYYKLVNKTIRGKIDISSAIGEAQIGGEQKNVPTITGMYALTTPLQSYQSLSDISNLVINCAGENSCFSDQAIGVFEFTDNTYSFNRWCAKINTATTVAYGPQLGDLNILRKTYDAYANEAFMGTACNIPDKSNAQYSHKAVTNCPALIECDSESAMGGCTDPFWNTALQGNITEGGTSSACYIKPYPIRMLDSLGGTVCYTPDLLTFFVDAITYLKPYAGLCLDYTCTNTCVGSTDPNCITNCKNAWDNQSGDGCGVFYDRIINNCRTVQSSEADNIRLELLDRTTNCISGTTPICDFQEALNENGDIIVSQIEKNITCTPSEEGARDCEQIVCCTMFNEAGITCVSGETKCLDNPSGEPGGTYYSCSGGVVQNGCACVESGVGTPITPPIGIYTQTIDECFKQNINGSYNIVVKV